jgi:hypothetical protein
MQRKVSEIFDPIALLASKMRFAPPDHCGRVMFVNHRAILNFGCVHTKIPSPSISDWYAGMFFDGCSMMSGMQI